MLKPKFKSFVLWPIRQIPLREHAIVPSVILAHLCVLGNTFSQTLSSSQVAGYAFSAGFRGGGLVDSIAIAWAESYFNTAARNYNPPVEDSRGLWQINILAHPEYAGVDLFNAANNSAAAYTLSSSGTDWLPWSTFGGSAWQNELDDARSAATALDSTVIVGSGNRVVATQLVNVRQTPAGAYIEQKPAGSTGTVNAGYVVALYTGYWYIWWQIQWDDDHVTGWSVEDALAKTATQPIQVTVQTSPSGQSFTVDGTTYNSGQTFSWVSGSTHSLSVTTPQSGGTGVQYIWAGWSDGGAASHSVSPTANMTFTASFTTQYQLTMNAGPGGTVSAGGWYSSGAPAIITATANSGYAFANWVGTGNGSYSGGNNPAAVTMNGPITETANFTPMVQYVSVTVQTSPSGQSFTVDGTTYNSAQTFSWVSGATHSLSVTTPQSGGTGVQYIWAGWSDGGAASHSVSPTANMTFTVSFTTQYQLTMNAGPGGTVSAGGWYSSGAPAIITATANSGYAFANWVGTGNGSYSGGNNPSAVTMNGPITEAANFTPMVQYVSVTVQTSPSGQSFTVDGTTYNSAQTFSWVSGSTHSLSVPTPQSGGTGVQYIWTGWSDGGAASHSVSPTANTTLTASFTTQYLLTMNAGPGGTVSAGDWYNSGATAIISATANSGYVFANWVGTGNRSYSGGSNPSAVTMNGPITETATFTLAGQQYQLTMVAGPGGTVTVGGWYASGGAVIISATASPGYVFANWVGTGSGSYSGTNNPATVTMNGSITEIASFTTLGLPPQLTGMNSSNGIFRFELRGPVGSNYTLQASTDLVHWNIVLTNVIPASATRMFEIAMQPNQPYQYFRAFPQTVGPVVLQPGPVDGNDIWTTSAYSYATCSSPGPGGGLFNYELRVGGWADLYYSLLQFDLTGLPGRATSAILYIYCFNQSGAGTPLNLNRITSPWNWRISGTGCDHLRLWWADQPSSVQWSPSQLPTPTQGQWYSLDITDLYNGWQSGTYPNYGIEFQPVLNSDNNFDEFYSANYLGDLTLRPKLVITP